MRFFVNSYYHVLQREEDRRRHLKILSNIWLKFHPREWKVWIWQIILHRIYSHKHCWVIVRVEHEMKDGKGEVRRGERRGGVRRWKKHFCERTKMTSLLRLSSSPSSFLLHLAALFSLLVLFLSHGEEGEEEEIESNLRRIHLGLGSRSEIFVFIFIARRLRAPLVSTRQRIPYSIILSLGLLGKSGVSTNLCIHSVGWSQCDPQCHI